jgi:hypothetical protein
MTIVKILSLLLAACFGTMFQSLGCKLAARNRERWRKTCEVLVQKRPNTTEEEEDGGEEEEEEETEEEKGTLHFNVP